ncbi:hypothetical protein CLTEP_02030 [Clostridium tepidiprofundi DSM 19306]|uniref:Smf/DprA SLOG domain-containing protein n=1 Tax=Clostridium tepidiprofundi DSM 19306 TaxID=1121338 RepID=A0A151B7P7_9CLOT|nr:DNA-processing protein DprA [Clostridium tepidiprofundi]KYH35810.1 hypothetical protein CLTEP_02030 [Clostridium tepidiprofundi DSM 19306]
MIDFDIWYSLVKLNPNIKLDILKKFKTTEHIWYRYIANEQDYDIFNSKIIKCLKNAWNKEKINKIKEKMLNDNVNIINYYDELYPQKLKNFDDSPSVMYYRGKIQFLNTNPSIAIVGARKCTFYGQNTTELIAKELAKNNINVISGMARGIDTFAHKVTIANSGFTCAVLGTGMDIIYPRENMQLYNELINNGCILSEFPFGTKPYPYNFPIRNRIISGLSDIVIVVEADIKSGSLITASSALNQGKDVMAVPGSVFSDKSRGTNKLIKDGAYPFTCMKDLFELLGIQYLIEAKSKTKTINSKNKNYGIINKLISDKPIHIDEIIRITNIDIKCLYELLFEMQINNEVKCLSGNYYVRINDRFS